MLCSCESNRDPPAWAELGDDLIGAILYWKDLKDTQSLLRINFNHNSTHISQENRSPLSPRVLRQTSEVGI